jgi:hypothetical protein
MCPFCLATTAIVVSSIAGTGGLAAAVTGIVLRKKVPKPSQFENKEVQDGNNSCDCSDAA